ncbi:hypothetical protein QIT55_gp24 [Nitrosopumilus spindle-shaped virus]|uniref:Uncharacterized protein n=1 Tax=Nitrosopumilus spindle-shaped virus 1 TaxID=2848002 RepID=A0A514K2Z9_9VIRU|nr:hypothetical protein QIT55_gp24 [Nitrosopumilus spindle-shaped virus]QDI74010.1 hypothetical protein [Nitrosopumilus spindle-shaped virus]
MEKQSLSNKERKFVEKLESKGLTPDQIDEKLRKRRKARKILLVSLPVLGVATYLATYVVYKTQELSWFFMTPPS